MVYAGGNLFRGEIPGNLSGLVTEQAKSSDLYGNTAFDTFRGDNTPAYQLFTADVANLGELRGLDLDEGGAGEFGEAAGDFRLADAGGADHQDVLRRDFVAQFLVHLHAPPAVTQRDGDGALGVVLRNDMVVQCLDDFTRCHLGH